MAGVERQSSFGTGGERALPACGLCLGLLHVRRYATRRSPLQVPGSERGVWFFGSLFEILHNINRRHDWTLGNVKVLHRAHLALEHGCSTQACALSAMEA